MRAVRTCRPVRRFVAALSCEKYKKIHVVHTFFYPENEDNPLFSLYLEPKYRCGHAVPD
ncbi:hypothetical protein BACUNI_03219 [Bacteroides uniformis ATCC 8492]|uniref:Uncharacterized protein n=1 Tax=Bacteroides uniformis (strain ATCC 8492 / DSM 6597 / CCUG 4942 / CIP 103695 / JCM 5828 / KCTC 5204 / NCTC 13054 / VPI 0061) TaxID=411479 RepID=A0ABC9N975_BACUC|nr:hypothetical protein BACUNI_03219 [Bacteroides uniformis ATCC 8492]